MAFWVEDLETGGVQHVISILARSFAARGIRTQILSCKGKGTIGATLPPEVQVIGLGRGAPLTARLLAARACLTRFPDILPYLLMIRDHSKTLAYLPGLISQLRADPPASGLPPCRTV